MSSNPWFKFYGSDFRDGVHDLRLEEVGAYTILLTRMYDAADGLIEDRDRLIAGWLNCDIRVWKRIRETLITAGKLYVDGGRLGNARVTKSKTSAELVANLRRTSGKRGGYVSAQVRAKSLKEPHTDEAKSKQNRSRSQRPEPERDSLSAPSGAERENLSLEELTNAQARQRSLTGARACAQIVEFPSKGLTEESDGDRPAWWFKSSPQMTPEERAEWRAYEEGKANG